MIFVLHGEDLSKSRDFILELQSKFKKKTGHDVHKIETDINDISPIEFNETVSSRGLFSETPFVVLDISKAGRLNLDEYIEIASRADKETVIIFLSNKSLRKNSKVIKSKKLNATVIENDITHSANVFNFLDRLFSKNRKQTYRELQNLLVEDQDPFYIFSMIVYGLRNLAFVKFDSPSASKMNPYTRSKFTNQSKNFSQEEISGLYDDLYSLDIKVKTGLINKDLLIPVTVEKVLS